VWAMPCTACPDDFTGFGACDVEHFYRGKTGYLKHKKPP
jgi:hypothetical protein